MITIYLKKGGNCPIILNFDNEVSRFLSKEAGLELERKIHEINEELSDVSQDNHASNHSQGERATRKSEDQMIQSKNASESTSNKRDISNPDTFPDEHAPKSI